MWLCSLLCPYTPVERNFHAKLKLQREQDSRVPPPVYLLHWHPPLIFLGPYHIQTLRHLNAILATCSYLQRILETIILVIIQTPVLPVCLFVFLLVLLFSCIYFLLLVFHFLVIFDSWIPNTVLKYTCGLSLGLSSILSFLYSILSFLYSIVLCHLIDINSLFYLIANPFPRPLVVLYNTLWM